MKSYDEIVEGLLERRETYIADKVNKRKKAVRISTSIGCMFVVVAVVSVILFGGGVDSAQPLISGDETKAHSSVNLNNNENTDNDVDDTSSIIPSNDSEKSTSVNGANKKPHKPSRGDGKTNSTSLAGDEFTTDLFEGETEPYVNDGKPNSDKINRNPNSDNGKGELETQGTTNDSPKYIKKIVVTRLPDKTTYYLGDKFDLRGLQVMGYFTNGEVEDITDRVYLLNPSDVAESVSNHYNIIVEFTDDSDCINIACDSFEVVVVAPDISISHSNLTLNEGDSSKLSSTTKASGCIITWFSTDTSVATVDDNGNVTAVGEGSASVYAEISYGSYKKTSDYCIVNVISSEYKNI